MSASPRLFDRQLLRARRERAARLGASTFLIDAVSEDFSDRLGTILRRFDVAVDLGTPTDGLRRALRDSGKVATIVAARADASPGRRSADDPQSKSFRSPSAAWKSAVEPRDGADFAVAAEEELLPFRDGSLDLVASALALQFVNDLPGTLVQIRRALKPDGLLLAAFPGGETLSELRQAFAVAESEMEDGVSPRVIPFVDVRDAGALLQRAGFALPVTDIDRLTVRYASPLALLHDLRRMGATNPLLDRQRRPLARATFTRMLETYAERFSEPDGRVRATFEIVWLSGWAPHHSQQQPLAPGSARQRLAEALGVREKTAENRPATEEKP